MQFVCISVLLHRLCVQDYVFQRCKLRKTVGKAGLDTFPSTLAQIKPRLSLMSYCCLCCFQTRASFSLTNTPPIQSGGVR